MSGLYPSLHEKFKSEGICPICLNEMAYSPRFSCDSDHVICQSCRPYYFSCPQCLQALHEIAAPCPRPAIRTSLNSVQPPSCPYPSPSAPNLNDFHEHERHVHWNPPAMPTEQPHLLECPYSHLGCTAKFVPALKDMHIFRCQYKHNNVEELTQVSGCDQPDDHHPCQYESHGCNVRLPHWRLSNHENICIYKNREPSPLLDCEEDEPIACKYESVGCNVRLSRYRLAGHEEICIYKNREPSPTPLTDCNDERIPCRYQSTGCNVRLPHWQISNHENICIYKDREQSPSSCEEDDRIHCRFQSVGCNVRAPHSRLRSHEDICIYKDRPSCDSGSVEELSQHMHGSCHVQEDPNPMVGCRYQAWGCNSRMPLWRQHAHEAQCIYRRH